MRIHVEQKIKRIDVEGEEDDPAGIVYLMCGHHIDLARGSVFSFGVGNYPVYCAECVELAGRLLVSALPELQKGEL